MAASRIPAPGSELGPCEPACSHQDCAHTRAMAATACSLCGKPIGYDVRFYDGEAPSELVHAACFERSVEGAASP